MVVFSKNFHRYFSSAASQRSAVTAILQQLENLGCRRPRCIMSIQIWQCGRSLVFTTQPGCAWKEKLLH